MKSTFMIAATGSGKGKTTFVSGLLYLLKDRQVHAFKCGPDYIDPMFHREVLGIPSTNLDSFFCDENVLRNVFSDNASEINVIEAAMGLYDGIGTTLRASAYETALRLYCPIILLIDGYGMGYSIVPLIKGFLSEDKKGLIKGVVINRISEKYYLKIAPVIEKETGIKVFGFIPKIKGAELAGRHLGLLSPEENSFDEKIQIIADQICKSVNINEILETCHYETALCSNNTDSLCHSLSGQIIAVADDEAFSFHYDENIKFLEREGAKIVYFSPLHDKEVPDEVDTIILYGGYPENYADALSKNKSMLSCIRRMVQNRRKVLAECGGFMYLLDYLNVDGEDYEMASVIKGKSFRTGGLVRFGYVSVTDGMNTVRAHEFHHYDTDEVEYSNDYTVINESSKEEYSGIVRTDNIFAGFPHLYYLSCPEMVIDFIRGTKDE